MSTDTSKLDQVKESAKAVATLVGTIVTGLLVVLVNDPKYAAPLAIIGAIATAVATWATPNAETPQQKAVREAGEEALLPPDDHPDGYDAAVAAHDYDEAEPVDIEVTDASEIGVDESVQPEVTDARDLS